MSELNAWGTDKSLINADEFCVECEHSVPGHYTNCPLRAPQWAIEMDQAINGPRGEK